MRLAAPPHPRGRKCEAQVHQVQQEGWVGWDGPYVLPAQVQGPQGEHLLYARCFCTEWFSGGAPGGWGDGGSVTFRPHVQGHKGPQPGAKPGLFPSAAHLSANQTIDCFCLPPRETKAVNRCFLARAGSPAVSEPACVTLR